MRPTFDRGGQDDEGARAARFTLDPAWRFTDLTPLASALLRRERLAVLGKVFWEVFPETVGSTFERCFRMATSERTVATFEAPSPALTGWFAFRATPGAEGLTVTCTDLTDRRESDAARHRAEEALRSSEERLELALRATPVTLFHQDCDLRYTWVRNPQLGLTAATLLGKTDDDILAPDDAAHFTAIKRHVLATGEQVREEGSVVADGETFCFDTIYEPVRDPDGTITGLIGITVDITARWRAEREQGFLNEASAVLAGSLDPATTLEQVARLAVPLLADYCVIDLFDADGHLRRVTTAHADPAKETAAQELRHYITRLENPRSNVAVALRTGRPVFDAMIDDAWVQDIAQSPAHLEILRTLNPGSLLATPLVTQDRTLGALIFFRTRGKEPYGATDLPLAGELAHRAAVALDNARLYHEAREAVAARDRFLSIASHELRTPVAGAKGYAQLLLRQQARGTLDAGRLTRGLQAIDDSADRLDRLTRDLLDVSRLRLDQFPLRRGPLDLAAFTRGVTAQFGDRLDSDHTLAVTLPDEAVPIDGDADRLEQVLTNLLENAVKYSPDGGEVSVTLTRDSDGALLRVQDRGIGLPSDSTETIFEPFGRASNSAARQIPGLGLGLHICREIIGRHGGWIRATSDGEDRGTTIAFWLPMVDMPRETEGGHG